jgi:threonine 3-dehydrogenase
MKKSAAPGATLESVAMPSVGPEDVLLNVRATSICGTDLHIYNWDSWAQSSIRPPLVFGHEFTGEVVETGKDVKNVRPGDVVSVESHVPCRKCHQCTHNQMHICDRVQILGVDRAGCFAEYVSIPSICAWKNSKSMPREIASIMEPMGNAVHAVSAAQVSGKTVVVFGCGPIGLFAIAVARAHDASRILAVDINPKRLEMARSVGAHALYDGADAALVDRLWKETGYGVDVTLEMSGSPKAVVSGLRSLKSGGTFVAFGIPSTPLELDLANDVILKGRTILGIVGRRMFETWEEMQRLLDSGKLNPAPIVTHQFPLTEFEKAFSLIAAGETGKVVLIP